jgi:predicted transcriptional regulator
MNSKIDPKDEKIFAYVLERNAPVTAKQVMKALTISETHAKRALDQFVSNGLAETTKQGSTRFYKAK